MSCLNHHGETEWHYGKTCAQYDEELKKTKDHEKFERLTLDLLEKELKTKRCPYCKAWITKTGGCNGEHLQILLLEDNQ